MIPIEDLAAETGIHPEVLLTVIDQLMQPESYRVTYGLVYVNGEVTDAVAATIHRHVAESNERKLRIIAQIMEG